MARGTRKPKAEGVQAEAEKPKTTRIRRPWLEQEMKIGQLLAALGDLGYQVDPEELKAAYNARGNRKVAKERDPNWLREQLEKVTGKTVVMVKPVEAVTVPQTELDDAAGYAIPAAEPVDVGRYAE